MYHGMELYLGMKPVPGPLHCVRGDAPFFGHDYAARFYNKDEQGRRVLFTELHHYATEQHEALDGLVEKICKVIIPSMPRIVRRELKVWNEPKNDALCWRGYSSLTRREREHVAARLEFRKGFKRKHFRLCK